MPCIIWKKDSLSLQNNSREGCQNQAKVRQSRGKTSFNLNSFLVLPALLCKGWCDSSGHLALLTPPTPPPSEGSLRDLKIKQKTSTNVTGGHGDRTTAVHCIAVPTVVSLYWQTDVIVSLWVLGWGRNTSDRLTVREKGSDWKKERGRKGKKLWREKCTGWQDIRKGWRREKALWEGQINIHWQVSIVCSWSEAAYFPVFIRQTFHIWKHP